MKPFEYKFAQREKARINRQRELKELRADLTISDETIAFVMAAQDDSDLDPNDVESIELSGRAWREVVNERIKQLEAADAADAEEPVGPPA